MLHYIYYISQAQVIDTCISLGAVYYSRSKYYILLKHKISRFIFDIHTYSIRMFEHRIFSVRVAPWKFHRIVSSLATLNIDSAKVLMGGNLLIFRPRDFLQRNANTASIATSTLRGRQVHLAKSLSLCHSLCAVISRLD